MSVNSTPELSLFLRVGAVIAQHVPTKAEMFTRHFPSVMLSGYIVVFGSAGFQEIIVGKETREFGLRRLMIISVGSRRAPRSAVRNMHACPRRSSVESRRMFGTACLCPVVMARSASRWNY